MNLGLPSPSDSPLHAESVSGGGSRKRSVLLCMHHHKLPLQNSPTLVSFFPFFLKFGPPTARFCRAVAGAMLVTLLSRLSLGRELEEEETRLQAATLVIQAAERGRSARLALHSERANHGQTHRCSDDGSVLPTGAAVVVTTKEPARSARVRQSVRMFLRGRGSRRGAKGVTTVTMNRNAT